MKDFYQKSQNTITDYFSIDPKNGLSDEQVKKNRHKYGSNELEETKSVSNWSIFLKSFKEPIVLVLIGAIILSVISAVYSFKFQNNPQHGRESLYEAITILILIVINSLLSSWQEISAKKSLDALKQMSNRYVKVIRNGVPKEIPVSELVVGDITQVKMGDFIEADIRWLTADELQVIESHLTGESDAIEKDTKTIERHVDIGDRFNMGYSGSTVSNGQGAGVVVATGKDTEMGNIARLIETADEKTSPLQTTITQLTKTLMKFSAGIIAITFTVGIFRAGTFSFESITSLLSTAISLVVASIPDAMPVVLSIVLTIGAAKLARDKGLIKSLSSVETLGSTSYISSDKTGTLTKNEMTTIKYYENGKFHNVTGLGYRPEGNITDLDSKSIFLKGAVLANESRVKKVGDGFEPFGNPTEIALNVLGQKAGVLREDLLKDAEIIRTFPFTSSRKMMSIIIKDENGYSIFTKGAPDVLLKNSQGILVNDQVQNDTDSKNDFLKIVDDYADRALRTLAVSYRRLSKNQALTGSMEELEQDLIVTGVAGIIDPPREEVKTSIKKLTAAHIEVVMITGDHAKTARAIAYDLGIVKSKKAPVITGEQLEQMSDDELFNLVLKVNVYARVTPEHKQRIIHQLQRQNQIVAMTGDGVNDAPALKAADIGIAMGITGTEVTKDSADLILLDDKFTTIENSVKNGRTIYANIRNFMRHELTTNVAEVSSLLLGLFFFSKGAGQVAATTPTLTALMVLWVNMVSDSLPSFALGYDVAESDVMKEKPRDPKESIMANKTLPRVMIRGLIMGLMVYVAFLLAAKAGMSTNEAQTVAFLTLVYGQLWHVFDARSAHTLFRRNPFENRYLVAAVLFAGIASFLVTIIPFFNTVMGTSQLPSWIYLLVIFIPALPTFILSGLKELLGRA